MKKIFLFLPIILIVFGIIFVSCSLNTQTVKSITATTNDANTITVSWDAADTMKGEIVPDYYRVLRATSKTGPFSANMNSSTVKGTSVVYDVRKGDISFGTHYFFQVQAVKVSANQQEQLSNIGTDDPAEGCTSLNVFNGPYTYTSFTGYSNNPDIVDPGTTTISITVDTSANTITYESVYHYRSTTAVTGYERTTKTGAIFRFTPASFTANIFYITNLTQTSSKYYSSNTPIGGTATITGEDLFLDFSTVPYGTYTVIYPSIVSIFGITMNYSDSLKKHYFSINNVSFNVYFRSSVSTYATNGGSTIYNTVYQ